MNYSELVSRIESTVENSFVVDDVNGFIKRAEICIYQVAQFPALRRTQVGTCSMTVPYLTMPADFIYPHSLAVVSDNNYGFLINVDPSFIREAYPNPTATGLPKYYGITDENSFILGPTPDNNYTMEIRYGYHPESIVTASTTWLGDTFPDALLSGCLVQAGIFLQSSADVMKEYNEQYMKAIALLKNFSNGQLATDSYRAGIARV